MPRSQVFCEACGAEIVWSRTENDKPIAIDKHTSADGNLIYRNGRVHQLTKAELDAIPENQIRYRIHLSTCKAKVKA